MEKLSNLFNIYNSQGLAFNQCVISENSNYAFINRSEKNNGIAGYIEPLANIKPFKAGLITVALSGSVLSTFYQTKPFYTAFHVATLKPKQEMTLNEIFYYILAIKQNKFKYNFGRQANRTLGDLILPSKNEIPDWVYTTKINDYSDIKESKNNEQVVLPPIEEWKTFSYNELFNLSRGNGGTIASAKQINGTNEFISSSSENNGISFYTGKPVTEKANTITIANNGSVGEAFYHNQEYLATSDVTVLELKNYTLTPSIAMFLIALIKQEQFKFNYGRKWGISRMINSIIKLPIKKDQTPDWELMENYINSLPYSKYL